MASRSPSPSRSPRATDSLELFQCLSGVGAVSVVGPDGVGLADVGIERFDHGIEVAVSVKVAEQLHPFAVAFSECLSRFGKGTGAVVDPDGVGLAEEFRDHGIEVTVSVEIAECD